MTEPDKKYVALVPPTPPSPMAPPKPIPFAMWLTIILALALAILNMVLARSYYPFYSVMPYLAEQFGPDLLWFREWLLFFYAMVCVISSLFYTITCISLFMSSTWARQVGIWLTVIGALICSVTIPLILFGERCVVISYGGNPNIRDNELFPSYSAIIYHIVIAALMLYGLTRPTVKRHFAEVEAEAHERKADREAVKP